MPVGAIMNNEAKRDDELSYDVFIYMVIFCMFVGAAFRAGQEYTEKHDVAPLRVALAMQERLISSCRADENLCQASLAHTLDDYADDITVLAATSREYRQCLADLRVAESDRNESDFYLGQAEVALNAMRRQLTAYANSSSRIARVAQPAARRDCTTEAELMYDAAVKHCPCRPELEASIAGSDKP